MMAHRAAPLNMTPHPLQEALQFTLALPATSAGQQTAQREIISALEAALDAFVHCDDRLASLLAMGLFASGVSASVLLIAAHDRPFVGQIAVTPKPLLQIVSDPLTKR